MSTQHSCERSAGVGSFEVNFALVAGLVLIFTGILKLGSSVSPEHELARIDPVFLVPMRAVFLATGTLELFLGLCVVRHRSHPATAGVIAVMAVLFLLYRAGVQMLGGTGGCGCLGNFGLTNPVLRTFSSGAADALLGFLLFGSAIVLILRSHINGNAHSGMFASLSALLRGTAGTGKFRLLLIGAPAALALAILVPAIPAFENNGDEGYNLMKAQMSVSGYRLYEDIWSDQPPLFNAILSLSIVLFGPDIIVPRSLVVLLAGGLIYGVMKLIVKVADILSAWLATLWLLSSPHFLWLSASVILAPVSLALAVLAVLALKVRPHPNNTQWTVLSALLFCMAVLTKFDTLLLLPAFLTHLWLYKWQLKSRAIPHVFHSGLVWISTVLSCFAIMVASLGWNSEMLYEPHLSKQVREAAAMSNVGRLELFTMLGQEWLVLLPTAVGAVFILRQRQWQSCFPLVWLTTEIAVRSWYRPFWTFHFEHVAVPLAWLAAIGLNVIWKRIWLQATFMRRHAAWSTLVVIFMASSWLSASLAAWVYKVQNAAITIAARDSSPEFAITSKMKDYDSVTRWVFADYPMYAFHAGLPMPPDLVVLSFKRFASGQLSEDELMRRLDKYQPEQIILRSPRFHRMLNSRLPGQYTLIMQHGAVKLYVRNDLVKEADKPRNTPL